MMRKILIIGTVFLLILSAYAGVHAVKGGPGSHPAFSTERYKAQGQMDALKFLDVNDASEPEGGVKPAPQPAGLPAVEVAESGGIAPEGGLPLEKAEELVAGYLAENGAKGDIPSHLRLAEITVREAWENTGAQLYRVELDYAWLYGIAAIKDGKVLCVLDGMPAGKVFLADLDNDGRYEIYANVSLGSGIVSLEIRGYNIASDTRYSLSMRMKKDLYLFIQDNALMVKEYLSSSPPMKAGLEPVSTGRLALRDGGKELYIEHPDGADSAPFYGSKAAYAAEDGLYCVDMGGGKAGLLVKGTGISDPVFSRDGKAIAYTMGGALYAYDFTTAEAKLLLEGADSYCPGRSGGFYASSGKAGIVAVNPQTAESSVIVPAESGTSYMHLRLSPDSRYLAYDTVIPGLENQAREGIWLYDAVSEGKRMIVKAEGAPLGMRPSVGRWSPDSGRLVIWLMSVSASLSADGVGTAVYDVAGGKLTELDMFALAYDENVSFAGASAFAMITGGGRTMFGGKELSRIDMASGRSEKIKLTPGAVPATPCYSANGKRLIFALSPEVGEDEDYESKAAALFKRQIYMCAGGSLSPLTKDGAYRSEAPEFLKDNNYIVFARINPQGEKSLWLMDADGSHLKSLACWKYGDPNDPRATDYYGRIDWSRMFDVFDDTRAGNG